MLPDDNRLVYDDRQGVWKVKFGGKLLAKSFKTHGEAFNYLADLKSGKVKPE